jgi:CysZ protein
MDCGSSVTPFFILPKAPDMRIMSQARFENTTRPPGFGQGVEAFLGGIHFILTTPSVWLHALVPTFMVLILACVFAWLGIWEAARATDALLGQTTGFWSTAGGWFLTIVLSIAAVLLALLLAVVLAQPLSAFALEAIVRAQERALGARIRIPPSILKSVLLSVNVVLFTLGVAIPLCILLFIIDIIFPPATVVTVPLRFLFTAWLLAWNFLDYPLAHRGMGLRARLHWVADRPGAFTGFGLAWAVVLAVPGMALLLLPMGVAGATRLVVGEQMSDEDWR